MRSFHVQLLFQAVTEGYSNHRVEIKIHMQYWHYLINLVSSQFKRNQETIRVLSKKKKQANKTNERNANGQLKVVIITCFRKCLTVAIFLPSPG